jgi:hypothetical protein
MSTYEYRGPHDAEPHTVEASACEPYEPSPNIYVFVRPTRFDDTTFPPSLAGLSVFAVEPPQEAD